MSRASGFPRLLGMVAAVLLVAGCTGTQELPPQDAGGHYDQVRQDVIAAAGAEGIDLEVREDPLVGTEDGTCLYDPGSWEADEELFTAEDAAWRPLLNPLNEALTEHGFEEVDEFEYTNGQAFGLSAVDEHGLRLRLYVLEGSTVLSMHGAELDDTEGCSAEVLGL